MQMINSASMVKLNKTSRNILILTCPFIIMSLINEIERPKIEYKSYNQNSSVITINPKDFNTKKCTWACHDQTKHCKINHVKILKPYYAYTDSSYMWVINKLKATGDYGLANIVFLVLLVPFIIIYFLIKSLDLQLEINKITKS